MKITKGRAKPHVEKTRKKELKRKRRGGGREIKWLKWLMRKAEQLKSKEFMGM